MAVDDGVVHAFNGATRKLITQAHSCIAADREHHKSGRVAIDAVNDDWRFPPAPSEILFEEFGD